MKKEKIKTLKNIFIVSFWILIFIVGYKVVEFKGYVDRHPTENYNISVGGDIPLEAQIKLDMIGGISNLTYLGVLLVFIIITVDYFYDPENHSFTELKKWYDKFQKDINERVGKP